MNLYLYLVQQSKWQQTKTYFEGFSSRQTILGDLIPFEYYIAELLTRLKYLRPKAKKF